MADFNSNFNDIQKQIAVADLTEEQIQELMNALQTRRNAKPKLTTEEKVFFQCCREHRSYANDKDFDAVVCPRCGSVKSIKHGTKNGRQRYKCKDLALFYWIEKNKDKSYLEQTYEIITLLSNQAKKIPLNKFKKKSISFDLKGMLS